MKRWLDKMFGLVMLYALVASCSTSLHLADVDAANREAARTLSGR